MFVYLCLAAVAKNKSCGNYLYVGTTVQYIVVIHCTILCVHIIGVGGLSSVAVVREEY